MARNGSGTHSRIHDWTADADAGIKIRADRMDAEFDDVSAEITASIAKDGQTTPTANLPMGGFRHTGVSDASARTDYASAGQIQDADLVWVDGGGTSDAITGAYAPAITALVNGMTLGVRATAANTTTTPTFAPNGLTAHTITKEGGTALVVGDIAGDGHDLLLRYDSGNTRWELLNPANQAISNLVEDTTPQLGGDLDLNGNSIDFPSTPNISDVLDEDDLSSDSATALATQQSIKAYVDAVQTSPTLGTEQAITSGTSADFTSIPSGTKKITMMLHLASLSGTDDFLVQIGDSGGLETSGYTSQSSLVNGTSITTESSTAGFICSSASAASEASGIIELYLEDSTNNVWVCRHNLNQGTGGTHCFGAGHKALSATLDRISLVITGSNTFDGSGAVNIQYE